MTPEIESRGTPSGSGPSAALGWIRAASLAPIAIGGILYFTVPAFGESLRQGISFLRDEDLEGLQAWGTELGGWAIAATSLLMLVQALAAPIPAFLVTATNSLLFGWVWGGVISIVSATVAATICYGLARGFGEPLVVRMVSAEKLARSDEFMRRHGTAAILVARLLPFVPFDPISFLAGLVRMPVVPFFVATLVGQIPAGMTYSYLAQQIGEPRTFAIGLVTGVLALVIIGLTVRRILYGRLGAHQEATS